jgi:hypothetical protein
MLAIICSVGLGAGLAVWTRAQSQVGNPSTADSPSPDAIAALQAQWGINSILDPVNYAAALNQLKTPDQLAQEQQALAAILQPAPFDAEAEATTPEQQQVIADMLDPVGTTARLEQARTPDQQAEVARAISAILQPQAQ